MGIFTIEVGLFSRKIVRNTLKNYKMEYIENKGLLSSIFVVEGNKDDLELLKFIFN